MSAGLALQFQELMEQMETVCARASVPAGVAVPGADGADRDGGRGPEGLRRHGAADHGPRLPLPGAHLTTLTRRDPPWCRRLRPPPVLDSMSHLTSRSTV